MMRSFRISEKNFKKLSENPSSKPLRTGHSPSKKLKMKYFSTKNFFFEIQVFYEIFFSFEK
jgi:hypothetical protein